MQGTSWTIQLTRKLAYSHTVGVTVGEIFFATNDDQVRTSIDKQALDNLANSIKKLTKEGFEISLLCAGAADFRGTDHYNFLLGKRRANSVKQYLENRCIDRRFHIDVISYGESKSLQPGEGNRPSDRAMKADRKVVITFRYRGFRPPVTIGITGNWNNRVSIAVREVNNGGDVVSIPGTPAWLDIYLEHQENQENRHRLARPASSVFDPLRPLVIIITQFSTHQGINGNIGFVECRAIHQTTRQQLFKESAQIEAGQERVKVINYWNPQGTVARVFLAKDDARLWESLRAQGYQREERYLDAYDTDILLSALLVDPIYDKLKGEYSNITDRIKSMLNYII